MRKTIMARKKQIPALPTLPTSHLIALDTAGFQVVRYLDKAVRVSVEGGEDRSEWLPALCVAPGDTPKHYKVIQWLAKDDPQNAYSFDGYQPSNGHSFGGMCETIGQALGWFTWQAEQKAKSGW